MAVVLGVPATNFIPITFCIAVAATIVIVVTVFTFVLIVAISVTLSQSPRLWQCKNSDTTKRKKPYLVLQIPSPKRGSVRLAWGQWMIQD